MERPEFLRRIDRAFDAAPVVALLGPRQSGKTTLARAYRSGSQKHAPDDNYFDLENVTHLARLETPQLALSGKTGLVVIDEIQKRPDLFPTLRVLVDRPKNRGKFLILGSASRDLIRQSSDTLAGRIQFIEVTPFSMAEVAVAAATNAASTERLWLRGGYPRSYLARSQQASVDWREGYIRTFLERDIPSLGIQIPALTLRRFWMMLTHYHGQTFNASEIGKSLGVADSTAKRYLDLLAGTFMIRRLQPWFENIGKRQMKLPKVYFRDSGIFHQLLGLNSLSQLSMHPKLGASWEGFALEQTLARHAVREEDAYFWGVHEQAELDLLIFQAGKRFGFEFKFSDAPKLTKSMQSAVATLGLERLTVVIPGKEQFSLADRVHVEGLERVSERKFGR
jgi:predicted AAA+ superfamily ATPase